MSSNDERSKSDSTDNFLDELESIKDILEQSDIEDELDIPILDDVIGSEASSSTNSTPSDSESSSLKSSDDEADLIDIDSVFDDDEELDDKSALENADPEQTSLEGDNPAESNLDFDGLDTSLTIPSFKLSVTHSDNSDEQAESDNQTLELTESPLEHIDVAPSQQQSSFNASSSDFDLDIVIQEIVDELIPVMEDQLRQRLSEQSPETIKQLAEKYLKS